MSAVVLRLFTGPHMGAELVLEPGEYVLGSSLDCDIIFQDSSVAPRHLRLLVEENPAAVRVIPLKGDAMVDGERLAADEELPPRTPCFVGLTCLAWSSPADDSTATADEATPDLRTAWDEVSAALLPVLHPSQAAESAPTEAEASAELSEPDNTPSEGGDAPDAEAVESKSGQDDAQAESDVSPPANKILRVDGSTADNVVLNRLPAISAGRSRNSRTGRVVCLVLLVLALCGLVFKTQEELSRPAQSVADIKQILAEAGFTTLDVTESDRGPLVSGRLADDSERGRLVRLVQRMHLPVYLNVQVDGDMTQALLTAFNSRELYPKVWAEREDEQVNLHVSGYMKDGVVEAWALAGAREDLPWLGPFLQKGTEPSPGTLTRSILYADGVELVLRPALAAAGLEKTQINYLPGTVEISGVFDVEARNRLDRTLEQVRERLGIPVVFNIREGLPELPQAVSGKTTGMHPDALSAPQKDGASPPAVQTSPSAFRVTGVTMTPMRFITLQSGERVFEGGALPGGYTLETISPSQLTLRRDGHTTTLTLRDANDQ